MLEKIDESRVALSQATGRARKSQLGQFFTPPSVAQFMAGLFTRDSSRTCHLLDAGAGIGSLSAAFLMRCGSNDLSFEEVLVDAFEIDQHLHHDLLANLNECGRLAAAQGVKVESTVRGDDFIYTAVQTLGGYMFAATLPKYSHAILNPPYRKIRSDSGYRAALRTIGIETVNMYSAFVALAVSLLDTSQGQLVAIIPRSFCNGPYYRPFRDYILSHAQLSHVHLFNSRDMAFKDDDVLQENVIVKLRRGVDQANVTVTTSNDDSFCDLVTHEWPFEQIVLPDDPARFIQIPTSSPMTSVGSRATHRFTLDELGISVSTGPVVDFRLKEHLRDAPEVYTVPLLYPCHVKGWHVDWPLRDGKKPNAIVCNDMTRKWLYPNGSYCVVRRFSSKEERRRIVASVIVPDDFGGFQLLGLENHLNVFHGGRKGLPDTLAHGLTVYLNSTVVDEEFRRFNGHTQVNATDLRRMRYPDRASLIALGRWAMQRERHTQDDIDEQLERL